jgi:hypothetical protein
MVRPVEHVVLGGAIEALESILGRSRKVKRLQTEVLQASVEILEARDKAIAAQVVVGISEDLDVGMQGFEGMLGVLRLSALRATKLSSTLQSSSLSLSVLSPSQATDPLTRQGLRDLLVHDHVDLHTALSRGFEHVVQAIAGIAGRGPAEVEFGTARGQHHLRLVAGGTITSTTSPGCRCTREPLGRG